MIEYISKNKAKFIVDVSTDGKRRRKTKVIFYNGKKDCVRQYRIFEQEVKGIFNHDATIEEICIAYIHSRKIKGCKQTTLKGYASCLNRIMTKFQNAHAYSIKTDMINNFIADMNNKYSSKTIHNTIKFLNASYNNAIKNGILLSNPCTFATLPQLEQQEIKTLASEDVFLFLKALDDELLDYKVGYELCLLSGLRRSEVLALTYNDFNADTPCVYIHKTRHRVKTEDVIQGTKTKRSNRNIAVPKMVAVDIEKLIDMHKEFDCDYLIQDGFGKKINPSTFSNHIYKVCDRIGIDRISVHALRHTFATMLNAEGVDVARISAELGHSNITTTLNKYTHIFGNISQSSIGIANSIDKKFGNSATFSATSENKNP